VYKTNDDELQNSKLMQFGVMQISYVQSKFGNKAP